MSWLSEWFGGGGGEDPVAVQQRIASAQAMQRAAEEAARQESYNQALAQAEAARQSNLSSAGSAFPSGFEASLIPSSLATPTIESTIAAGRGKAQDFISNAVRRGTVTPVGQQGGMKAIEAQDPTVRSRLTDVGNLLLEQERAKVRGIGNEATSAAAKAGAAAFDITPYRNRAQTEASTFAQGFPAAFGAAVPSGDLYTGLGEASNVVTGQPEPFDPYAATGGALKTGLEDQPAPGAKKRTTAVF